MSDSKQPDQPEQSVEENKASTQGDHFHQPAPQGAGQPQAQGAGQPQQQQGFQGYGSAPQNGGQQPWGAPNGWNGQQPQQPPRPQQPPQQQGWQSAQQPGVHGVPAYGQAPGQPYAPNNQQWAQAQGQRPPYGYAPQPQGGYRPANSMPASQQVQVAIQKNLGIDINQKPILVWIGSIVAMVYGVISALISISALIFHIKILSDGYGEFASFILVILSLALLATGSLLVYTGVLLFQRKNNRMIVIVAAVGMLVKVVSFIVEKVAYDLFWSPSWGDLFFGLVVPAFVIVSAVLPVTVQWINSNPRGFEPRGMNAAGSLPQARMQYGVQQPARAQQQSAAAPQPGRPGSLDQHDSLGQPDGKSDRSGTSGKPHQSAQPDQPNKPDQPSKPSQDWAPRP